MISSNATSNRTARPDDQSRKRGFSSSNIAERYSLSSPSTALDPRYDAFRGDLADIALAGRLFTPHYAAPLSRKSIKAAPLLSGPDEAAEPLCELEKGEGFALLDITGGWAWGYREADHLVGYVRADTLEEASG